MCPPASPFSVHRLARVQDNSEVLKKMGELLESTQRQLTDIRQRLEPTPTPTPSPGLLDFLGDILP